jgi:hypothetical protein
LAVELEAGGTNLDRIGSLGVDGKVEVPLGIGIDG